MVEIKKNLRVKPDSYINELLNDSNHRLATS
jgi:hypothetical protein